MKLDNYEIYILKKDSADAFKQFEKSLNNLNNLNIPGEIYYCGIDFEFNRNQIALCQFALYHTRKIFIFNPATISHSLKKLWIDQVLVNKNIYKIMHGAESLDIPFIESYISSSNDGGSKFINFIQYFIDTRFICELEKISAASSNIKCSLYDAFLHYNAITKEKHEFLEKNHDDMGPIYKIYWDVNRLSYKLIVYAAYDVIFLKDLYMCTLKKYKKVSSLEEIKILIKLNQLVMISKNIKKYDIKQLASSNNSNYDIQKILESNDLIMRLNKIDYFRKTFNAFLKYVASGRQREKFMSKILFDFIKKNIK